MRNYFFLLTVLAVTIWMSDGDQTAHGDRQNDFYLADMEEGSGDLYSSYSSYYSEVPVDDEDDYVVGPVESGEMPIVGVSGSMHLNKVFIEDYNNPNSSKYMELENEFVLAMNELMTNSPLSSNYISTTVIGFSPGSVKVDFEVKMSSISRMEESLGKVIEAGVQEEVFALLQPNASSLVIKPQGTDNDMMFTTPPSQDKNTPPLTDGGDVYRPKPGDKDDDDDEVDVEEKNILDLILGDPIIIAAIVGGLIVILLSIILLFLFVVYRLKKKDEGSYSLDEPAKAKDPTAYWKETKEFYA